ncbi:DUF4293 domain-containing protein [Chitinophaga deserti]|uniref:DUF4293 domain-containing protein n=1 Tax=Chitinophaga deserti TaxID=2164099 RepID=UPI000D6D5F05|nr:DUF4293 domain-containing protein [Chitinophaga deserti]
MIQRIQSLYLLLAALAGVAVARFDLWKATYTKGNVAGVDTFNATSNYMVFIVLIIGILLSVGCIFLYKNRQLQFRLTVVNILLSIGILALIYLKIQESAQKLSAEGAVSLRGSYLIPAFLPVVMIVLLFLAARGIYKDQKLIKSLDRLR